MGFNIKKIGSNQWYLDVRVKKAGHLDRKRETFQGTKVAAEERYLCLRKELQSGYTIRASFKTFTDVMAFYREKRVTFSKQDESRYAFLIRELGTATLPTFADRFEGFIALHRRTPTRKTKKPPSGATLNRLVEMVRAAINMALEAGFVTLNPISKRRFPKFKEIARDRVLSEGEEVRFLEVMAREAPHILHLTRFALQVPCRKSELVKMRRDDLDLINNAIRVRNGTTKNDQGLWKPIPPDMVAYFRAVPAQCPWLFYRENKGDFLPLGDFRKAWKRCLGLAGISDFRVHDTRHVSASRLLDNDTPEQVVMQVAGWKTNMLKTYYHRGGKNSFPLIRFSSQRGTLGVHLDDGDSGNSRKIEENGKLVAVAL